MCLSARLLLMLGCPALFEMARRSACAMIPLGDMSAKLLQILIGVLCYTARAPLESSLILLLPDPSIVAVITSVTPGVRSFLLSSFSHH